MQKTRILGLAAAVAGGAVSVTALVSACSTYDQPKAVAEAAGQVPDTPDWNWHVRPILSQNCFGCHGSGTQKAGLRLDDPKVATGDLPENKGHRAIVPGNPGKSEIFKRILSSDPDFRMPPKDTHKTLTPLEIATLQKWVKQGAKYKPHWAYITPKEVRPERTEWDKQAVNPIDRYIYAGLKKAGLSPSPEADKETLINRVTLDLTGLPPTLAEVDAFVADKSPNAYEKLVDRLLASRQYAERQTNIWLDVARYSDTRGGLFDQEASFQHPYRDWLITAFQRNIPYDKFVTWQLAGDKLPNATREQILATGFLRAGKKDSEGGVIDEEYRVNYVNERAELMGKAFLGLTVGCAKCHNHKYDVISQADYYSMGGFFNSMEERGIYSGSNPMGATLAWPTPMQARAQAAAEKTAAAKWAAYQQVLAQAKARAAASIDRMPAAQRAAYLQQDIAGATIAYYPFDSGYKASFEELKYDPTPLGAGAPDPLGPEPKPPGGLTRQDWQLKLQKDILAEAKDRQLHPEKYAAADKAKAEKLKASLAKNGGQQLVDRRGRAIGPATGPKDPDAPRIARLEVDAALDMLAAKGFKDSRRADPQRVPKRDLPVGIGEKELMWTPSGLPGGKPGAVHRVKFIPGAKGQAVQIHDSVVMAYPGTANFERTEAWTLDFWVKLRKKDYEQDSRPEGPQAVMLGNNGQANSPGYELGLDKGKLQFAIISNAPYNMIKIAGTQQVPRERWVHITATYDGNSKAAGMRLYQDGEPMQTEVVKDRLSGSTKARNSNSYFGGYYGLSAGTGFNRPEMVDGGYDELRVLNRALTPAEVALLHNPSAFAALAADAQRASLVEIAASKDPAVQKAWAELTAARLSEQKVEAGINQLLVAADTPKPRVNHILDRGIYNTYLEEVPTQALPRVFKWDKAKLPANRLGLAQWLFDPKHPLTSRVYVNRMWRDHFGSGIVQTVDDFGTQGTNPTNPELLDYLAIEFVRSGWDMKHMHKLMVMSATYRQSSAVTPDRLEKDPRNFLLARGPRYRLSAEQLRDSALFVSALLVDKPGGDSVFPVQPDLIWEGVAQGFVVYPTNVPDDQNHRRSMYTFAKRNQGPANMLVFDASDRTQSVVARTISNTPLQALALMNDPQFLEAYRKLAERSMKSTANPDQQLVTLFRLGARRHPTDRELVAMRKFRADEEARAAKNPTEVTKLLKIGAAPTDASLDPVKLTAMTVVAAGVMNSPAAYTLR
jgi:hypothetical protein